MNRYDARAIEAEIAVCAPYFTNVQPLEQDEAARVDVGELVTAEAFQLSNGGFVQTWVDRREIQARQIGERQTKRAGRVLAEAVKEPAVGLPDHAQRRVPSARRSGKQTRGFGMVVIGPIEEGDEDAAVEKDRTGSHGRGRP